MDRPLSEYNYDTDMYKYIIMDRESSVYNYGQTCTNI